MKYLMIVPNSLDHGGELLLTLERKDMRAVIERHGYREAAKDPKYADPVLQDYAVNPTYHFFSSCGKPACIEAELTSCARSSPVLRARAPHG